MERPERIWTTGTNRTGWWNDIDSCQCPGTEYVRKDIHDDAVSKARVDALKEAADIAHQKSLSMESGPHADMYSKAYSSDVEEVSDAILALIEKEPKP